MSVFSGCTKFVQAPSHSAAIPPVAHPSTWRLQLRFNSKVATVPQKYFSDAIASPSSYPCQWVSQSVIDSFRFGDSYRISELCELVSTVKVLFTSTHLETIPFIMQLIAYTATSVWDKFKVVSVRIQRGLAWSGEVERYLENVARIEIAEHTCFRIR